MHVIVAAALSLILCSFATVVYADDTMMATVSSVSDGDTIELTDALIPNLSLKWRVRIRGVDTAELKSKCVTEHVSAVRAKTFLSDLLRDNGNKILLSNIAHDKYGGRLVARVQLLDNTDVSEVILDSNLGYKYTGGTKRSWCTVP